MPDSLQSRDIENELTLWQLHSIDRSVPLAETLGEVRAMQDEGLIRHVGLSNVAVADIELARTRVAGSDRRVSRRTDTNSRQPTRALCPAPLPLWTHVR